MDATIEATGSQVSAIIDRRNIKYRIGAPGRHWVVNSLAVLAACVALGADLEKAAAALAQISAPKGRGKRHTIGRDGEAFVLIDDSYNASPASMRASFEVLAASPTGPKGRRIAVLGDMLELGPESPKLHAGLAGPIVAAQIDQVFTCGPNMARLHEALPPGSRAGHAANSEQLLPMVRAAIRPGDVVVVKGSLGSRMGHIVDALLAGASGGDGQDGARGRAANG
jgi:UDP-N-acetylmuramoyl-tripeptide--D-alanyl-D-alanine ligase